MLLIFVSVFISKIVYLSVSSKIKKKNQLHFSSSFHLDKISKFTFKDAFVLWHFFEVFYIFVFFFDIIWLIKLINLMFKYAYDIIIDRI